MNDYTILFYKSSEQKIEKPLSRRGFLDPLATKREDRCPRTVVD